MRKTRLISIIFSALPALLLQGCRNYLNVQPQGYVIPATDEEFASIMHGHLQDIEGGGDDLIVGNMEVIARLEGCADDLDANIKVGELKAYAGELFNVRMTDYCELYEVIRDCNIVIENLDGRTSRKAADVLSCAYAVKGICYLNLIRDFCEPWEEGRAGSQLGVPIVEKFDINARPPRATLEESVAYCGKLLRRSLELEMSDKLFIFTEYVTKAYLARLLFWSEQWDACAGLCEDILLNSGLQLCGLEDFAETIQAANDCKGEVLIRSHINNASELDWYFSYIRGYIASRPASYALVSLFGDEPSKDVRWEVSFNEKRCNNKTPECRVRLSEMLLMLAECYCHQGHTDKALEQLNLLRRSRIADVVDYTEATLPPVRSGERIVEDARGRALTPLLQAIFDERRRELYMEGDRWYELKRNGRPEWWIINNGLKYTTEKYMYTAPIYKGDVDLDANMIQNEGYR